MWGLDTAPAVNLYVLQTHAENAETPIAEIVIINAKAVERFYARLTNTILLRHVSYAKTPSVLTHGQTIVIYAAVVYVTTIAAIAIDAGNTHVSVTLSNAVGVTMTTVPIAHRHATNAEATYVDYTKRTGHAVAANRLSVTGAVERKQNAKTEKPYARENANDDSAPNIMESWSIHAERYPTPTKFMPVAGTVHAQNGWKI